MARNERNISVILTVLFLLHLSVQTNGLLQSSGQNQGQNHIRNASFGFGRRGSGSSSGSGSAGTLPPCSECFGHGRNPNSDPRCQLGCRGVVGTTPTTRPPINMKQKCPEGGACHRGADTTIPARDDSTVRRVKLKRGIIVSTIVLCMVIVVAVIIKRLGPKFSTVGVFGRHDETEMNNVQI